MKLLDQKVGKKYPNNSKSMDFVEKKFRSDKSGSITWIPTSLTQIGTPSNFKLYIEPLTLLDQNGV